MSFLDNKKYQIVIIDYPIFIFDDLVCAGLLGKTFKMKFEGYSATYKGKVLPMDKSDFFSTHIIFCEKNKDVLIPICAYKSTSLARCLEYNFEFPGLSLMKSDGDLSCVKSLEYIISKTNDPSLISFDSSWAQNLNYRFSKNLAEKEALREIMMMLAVKHHKDFNVPHMITCGAVKVKTDQFFLKLGLNPLNDKSHFFQKSLGNEEAVIFYGENFSTYALNMAKKYESLWSEKLMINGNNIITKIAA